MAPSVPSTTARLGGDHPMICWLSVTHTEEKVRL